MNMKKLAKELLAAIEIGETMEGLDKEERDVRTKYCLKCGGETMYSPIIFNPQEQTARFVLRCRNCKARGEHVVEAYSRPLKETDLFTESRKFNKQEQKMFYTAAWENMR